MLYSRSVWYEQVDTALYELIKNTVFYKDEDGTLKFVEPCFSLDEEDIKTMSLPTVMIRSTGERFDLYRYEPNPLQMGTTPDNKVILEESAKPYTLLYQLDFLSRYKVDMNDILRTWYAKIPKRYLLDVKDMEGTPRQCYMLQVRPTTTLNQKYGDNILYRTIIQYEIKVELDEGQSFEVYGVSGINLGFK